MGKLLRRFLDDWRFDSEIYSELREEIRQELAQKEARIRELEDLLEWQTHLHHGIGKDGGSPSDAEWEDCLEQSKNALSEKSDKEE